jgi:hypothetical protein
MGCTSHPETKELPAKLYLVKIILPSEQFVKIGITSDEVSARFKLLHDGNVEILQTISATRYNAVQLEQRFISTHKRMKYYPSTLPKSVGGHTECFHVDYLDVLVGDFVAIC